ncbi:hypothetical protein, partial [Salmonella enterica subsp. enterica serovar Bredeney]
CPGAIMLTLTGKWSRAAIMLLSLDTTACLSIRCGCSLWCSMCIPD